MMVGLVLLVIVIVIVIVCMLRPTPHIVLQSAQRGIGHLQWLKQQPPKNQMMTRDSTMMQ
jgi:branched-subunit amino acid transport protein AzlD